MEDNKSLFFVFNREQAYCLMVLGFPVKKLDFVKGSMETSWAFEETEEFMTEYLKLKNNK